MADTKLLHKRDHAARGWLKKGVDIAGSIRNNNEMRDTIQVHQTIAPFFKFRFVLFPLNIGI